jgi:hypothetical protein
MDGSIATWLGEFGSSVFRICALLFVAVNAVAIGAVVITRSRQLVQKWTGPWLVVNAVLVGAGAGVPLMTGIARTALWAAAGSMQTQAASAPTQARLGQ